jgi:hypothetical protein
MSVKFSGESFRRGSRDASSPKNRGLCKLLIDGHEIDPTRQRYCLPPPSGGAIALIDPVSLVAEAQGVPLIMDETYLQRPGSSPVERSRAADVFLREEPDEEENDEEEHDGNEEDDDGDEGYSE